MAEAIAAIATAISPDQGSVGIVRLSGDGVVAIAQSLFKPVGQQVWESHRVLYGHVVGPEGVVDEVLLLVMLAPRSYTREDVVEFHCHGGIMAVQQVLQLCLQRGVRLAQAGEFTLRAFLNGRLDLTQAESVMDLVGAKSPQAAAQALAGLQGRLAGPVREVRSVCLDILAQVEARIDFADDLPPLAEASIVTSLQAVLERVRGFLATADRGELLRTGLKVAIVGRPNVGKSSLLNAWSRSDRAIVTDLPGTTRDVVESQLVVGGFPVRVLDTAGIRETADRVESIGVERSRRAAEQADVVLFTIAADQGWTEADEAIFQGVGDRPGIIVVNKVDLVGEVDLPDRGKPVVRTAAALKEGIVDLEAAILAQVRSGQVQAANLEFAINQRQAAALQQAQNSLEQVMGTIADQMPLDFWTIDLRSGIAALSAVLGEDVTESMLDRVFGQFCIGK
jgi:tRNA modification GTPase